MLNNAPLMAFVATTNADAARVFYENTLGLTFLVDEPFALVFESNGVPLRIQKVQQLTVAQHTMLGWIVDDIAESVRQLTAGGVAFVRYEFMAQDTLGICTFEDGVMVAWFRDPDGNLLSLTQIPAERG